jgi:hypothetical protein
MKVPWPYQRCVICLAQPGDTPSAAVTDTHVIPEFVGGRLSAALLCKGCNNKMGETEALLAQDISVRLLADKLENRLPSRIVGAIRRRQTYFSEHDDLGHVEAVMDKSAELRPRRSASVKGERDTLDQALAELGRRGASAEEQTQLRTAFEVAAAGDWIDVRPGYRIQKHVNWSGVRFRPTLTDPIVPLEVPVGIAYLYLALCLRAAIYHSIFEPARQALRQAFVGDPAAAEALCANRHGTRITEPLHLLRARDDGDGILVIFYVFRDLCWPVRFPGRLRGLQTLYCLDLEQGSEYWATSLRA